MDRSSALAKVLKLLALAKSNPGHEANSAASMAQELCQQFNFTPDELEPLEIISLEIDNKNELWKELVAFSVSKYVNCKIFSLKKGGLSVSGDKKDCEHAKVLYDLLCEYAARSVPFMPSLVINSSNLNNTMKLLGEVWRERFYYGFAKAVSKRMIPVKPREDVPATYEAQVPEFSEPPESPVSEEEPVSEEKQAESDAREEILEKGFKLRDDLTSKYHYRYATDLASGVFDLAYSKGLESGLYVNYEQEQKPCHRSDRSLPLPEEEI